MPGDLSVYRKLTTRDFGGRESVSMQQFSELHGLGKGSREVASDEKLSRLHNEVFKGVEYDFIQDNLKQDSIQIESKIFCFALLDSSLLQISQIKGNRSELITLDGEGFRWMHNILRECISSKSFKHWVYTRFESSRDLKIAFKRNRFESFIRFVELK